MSTPPRRRSRRLAAASAAAPSPDTPPPARLLDLPTELLERVITGVNWTAVDEGAEKWNLKWMLEEDLDHLRSLERATALGRLATVLKCAGRDVELLLASFTDLVKEVGRRYLTKEEEALVDELDSKVGPMCDFTAHQFLDAHRKKWVMSSGRVIPSEKCLFSGLARTYWLEALSLGDAWVETLRGERAVDSAADAPGQPLPEPPLPPPLLRALIDGTLHHGTIQMEGSPGLSDPPAHMPPLLLRAASETVSVISLGSLMQDRPRVLFAVGVSDQCTDMSSWQEIMHALLVYTILPGQQAAQPLLAVSYPRAEDGCFEYTDERFTNALWTATPATCSLLADALGIDVSGVGAALRWVLIAASNNGHGQPWWYRLERLQRSSKTKLRGLERLDFQNCSEEPYEYLARKPPLYEYDELQERCGETFEFLHESLLADVELRILGGAAVKAFPELKFASHGEMPIVLRIDSTELKRWPEDGYYGGSPRGLLLSTLNELEAKVVAGLFSPSHLVHFVSGLGAGVSDAGAWGWQAKALDRVDGFHKAELRRRKR